MTLLLVEGFDHYNSDFYLEAKGWTQSSVYYTSSGRISGKCVYFPYSSPSPYVAYDWGGTNSTIYFGIAIKKAEGGVPTYLASIPLISFRDEANTNQIKIHVNSSNGLSVYKGDNTLIEENTSALFGVGAWNYLTGKITISATVGEVTLEFNGDQIINATSEDTKNGTDYVTKINLMAIFNGLDTYFDDLYIDNSQSHGNCHVNHFAPDSDSATHTDFERSSGSNDYEMVEDDVPDGDSTYIKSSTVGHISTFGITTGSLETVKGIQVNNLVKVAGAGNRKIKTIVRSNSTDYQSAESAGLPSTYKYEKAIWETDPDDSNPWTQTKLEAAEFGLEITT